MVQRSEIYAAPLHPFVCDGRELRSARCHDLATRNSRQENQELQRPADSTNQPWASSAGRLRPWKTRGNSETDSCAFEPGPFSSEPYSFSLPALPQPVAFVPGPSQFAAAPWPPVRKRFCSEPFEAPLRSDRMPPEYDPA